MTKPTLTLDILRQQEFCWNNHWQDTDVFHYWVPDEKVHRISRAELTALDPRIPVVLDELCQDKPARHIGRLLKKSLQVWGCKLLLAPVSVHSANFGYYLGSIHAIGDWDTEGVAVNADVVKIKNMRGTEVCVDCKAAYIVLPAEWLNRHYPDAQTRYVVGT